MKQLVIELVTVVFVISLITTTATAQQSAEVKILNQWLGSWTSDVVIKPSKWVPEQVQWIETSEVQWIVDSHMHMQLMANRNDEQENLALQRYNTKSRKYELWTFGPDSSGYYIGSWNEKSRTMTWKYVDFGAGITGKIVDHFTGDGKWHQTVILKDKKRNVLLDIQVERTHTK